MGGNMKFSMTALVLLGLAAQAWGVAPEARAAAAIGRAGAARVSMLAVRG